MRLDLLDGQPAVRSHYRERKRVRSLGCRWSKERKVYEPQCLGHARFLAQRIDASPEALRFLEPSDSQVFRLPEVPLYRHQQEGVQWLREHPRGILADDLGIGKTRQALTAVAGMRLPALAVVPAAVRREWIAEVEATGLEVALETVSWAKLPLRSQIPWKRYVVLADEAHYAQNTSAKRTKRFLWLADDPRVQACWLLTGTPMANGQPRNLFPLLRAIWHPLGWDQSFYELRYCDAKATRWTRWDTTGCRNLEELQEAVQPHLLRRRKAECLDLPEKVRVLREVEPSRAAKRAYESKWKECLTRWHRRGKWRVDPQVELNYLRQASSAAKVPYACEVAREAIEQGSQVLIYSAYRESAQRAAEALPGCPLIWGSQNPRQRKNQIQRFVEGEHRVLSSTIGAGGVGLNLQVADVVVMIDRAWTPGETIQAEDRAYRIGTESRVTVYWLQYGEIDQRVDHALVEKAERIGGLYGDQSVVEEVFREVVESK